MNKAMKDIFLKLIFTTRKNYMKFIMSYHFHQKERKLKKQNALLLNLYDKNEYVIHIRNLKQELNYG